MKSCVSVSVLQDTSRHQTVGTSDGRTRERAVCAVEQWGGEQQQTAAAAAAADSTTPAFTTSRPAVLPVFAEPQCVHAFVVAVATGLDALVSKLAALHKQCMLPQTVYPSEQAHSGVLYCLCTACPAVPSRCTAQQQLRRRAVNNQQYPGAYPTGSRHRSRQRNCAVQPDQLLPGSLSAWPETTVPTTTVPGCTTA
jgi:hypothetical protein